MTVARALAFALAAAIALAAVLGLAGDPQPSLARVAATSVVALLAPLFASGRAATAARTALGILAWAAFATALAAALTFATGSARQALPAVLAACATLFPIVLASLAVSAALEGALAARGAAPVAARATAGRAAAFLLALAAFLPVWAGPAAERFAGAREGLLDALLAASPLMHLAVASGNDLLRSPWFYQHANLANLQATYPTLTTTATAWCAIAIVALWLHPLAGRASRAATASASLPPTETLAP